MTNTDIDSTDIDSTEAEAQGYRNFIQGTLLGTLINLMDAGSVVSEVQQGREEDGNYESHFVVITKDGHRIRVSTEVER